MCSHYFVMNYYRAQDVRVASPGGPNSLGPYIISPSAWFLGFLISFLEAIC
jgi:hypothetical protein